jgi:hypothetical protein
MSVNTLEPQVVAPDETKLPWHKRTGGRRLVAGFLVGGVMSAGFVFGPALVAPSVAPEYAAAAEAAPCRNVVVPGSGAVAKQCNTTPLPSGVRKCASGTIAGVAAGARTGGKKGAIGGAVAGAANCLADAVDGGD